MAAREWGGHARRKGVRGGRPRARPSAPTLAALMGAPGPSSPEPAPRRPGSSRSALLGHPRGPATPGAAFWEPEATGNAVSGRWAQVRGPWGGWLVFDLVGDEVAHDIYIYSFFRSSGRFAKFLCQKTILHLFYAFLLSPHQRLPPNSSSPGGRLSGLHLRLRQQPLPQEAPGLQVGPSGGGSGWGTGLSPRASASGHASTGGVTSAGPAGEGPRLGLGFSLSLGDGSCP